jgi:uncharacterized repeat protein (TIGR03803 family)
MKMKKYVLSSLRSLAMLIAMLIVCAAMAAASSEFVIYDFTGTTSGCQPVGNLVADSAGNLYGVAQCGGFNAGIIYELTRPVAPATAWTETVLYNFTGGDDGGAPQAGLIFDAAGNLYGTASTNGAEGCGTVFELSPPASVGGDWTFTVLYSFKGTKKDGSTPLGSLIWDSAGNLYGTTTEGGSPGLGAQSPCVYTGCGIIFELSPPATVGGTWTETILHFFQPTAGGEPRSAPIFGTKGNLYGTASVGGTYDDGVVYGLTPPAAVGGAWIYKVLYAFSGEAGATCDGAMPYGSLILRGKDVLYGTTTDDGSFYCGYGTVFQLTPPAVAGGEWTETSILTFRDGVEGGDPMANVIFDSAGNLYSTTYSGNSGNVGEIFELSPPASGTTWTLTNLHIFNGEKDGANPNGGLIAGEKGILYGITQYGGAGNEGTVYAVVK